MVLVYTMLGLVLLRVVAILLFVAFLIGPAAACPACFQPSVPIRHRWLARLFPWLEWRWCPSCGWQGPARRARPAGS